MNLSENWLICGGLCAALIGSVVAIGALSRHGFTRFRSRQFWSMLAGTLAVSVFAGFFVSIMSVGGPNIENPSMVAASVFLMIVLAFTLIGTYASYFLFKPADPIIRIVIGGVAVPMAAGLVVGIIARVVELAAISV